MGRAIHTDGIRLGFWLGLWIRILVDRHLALRLGLHHLRSFGHLRRRLGSRLGLLLRFLNRLARRLRLGGPPCFFNVAQIRESHSHELVSWWRVLDGEGGQEKAHAHHHRKQQATQQGGLSSVAPFLGQPRGFDVRLTRHQQSWGKKGASFIWMGSNQASPSIGWPWPSR